MSDTVQTYGHTLKLLHNKEVTYTNLKCELLSASASFNVAHTAMSSVDNSGAYEVSGNGWPSGGQGLTSVAVTTVNTDDVMIDADDISVDASGGSIGPAAHYVIKDATSNKPLFFVTPASPLTALDGAPFRVILPAGGLYSCTI